MNFRRKCVDKIFDYKKRGKSMFFCSHSLYDVRQICEHAIWMRQGRMQMLADAITVTNEYATYENKIAEGAGDPVPFRDTPQAETKGRSNLPHVVDGTIIDPASGQPRNRFSPGDPAAVRVHVKNPTREKLVVAVGAMRTDGTLCFGHTTQFAGVTVDFAEGYVTLFLDGLSLLSGEFTVPIWLFDENGVHRFEERPASQNLIVANRTKDVGLFLQPHRWVVEPKKA